jgi:hypothetical protein
LGRTLAETDVSVKKDGEVVEVGEVGRQNKDATLVSRERAKLLDYQNANLDKLEESRANYRTRGANENKHWRR